MLKIEDDCSGGGGGNGWARICEACERVPAAFICKADAAALCAACDADIHSANPLARRHHRVPIMMIPGAALAGPNMRDRFFGLEEDEIVDENDEDEAASWLLLNPVKATAAPAAADGHQNSGNGFLFGGEEDDYLNFVEFNTCGNDDDHEFVEQFSQQPPCNAFPANKNYGGDSVVPVQQQKYQLGSEYGASKAGYCYNGFISHSVSVSSLEVGVVPESTASDMSISNSRTPKGTIDLFAGTAVQIPATQLTAMDREARVLRYREKKKMRKFEKTIRYASRKAYAETRPRIKGRFAKRSEMEPEVDRKFSNPLMAEMGYGIVPSF